MTGLIPCPRCGIDDLFTELVASLPWKLKKVGKKRRLRRQLKDLVPDLPKEGVTVQCTVCKLKVDITPKKRRKR